MSEFQTKKLTSVHGFPKWTTPKILSFQMSVVGRIAIYILLLHIPCLFLSVWSLGAILSNCACNKQPLNTKSKLNHPTVRDHADTNKQGLWDVNL